jgi:hypothetical protein
MEGGLHAEVLDFPGVITSAPDLEAYSVPRREVDTSGNWKTPWIRVEEHPL